MAFHMLIVQRYRLPDAVQWAGRASTCESIDCLITSAVGWPCAQLHVCKGGQGIATCAISNARFRLRAGTLCWPCALCSSLLTHDATTASLAAAAESGLHD